MRENDPQDYRDFDPPYAPTGRYGSDKPKRTGNEDAALDPKVDGRVWVNHHREGVRQQMARRRMMHEIVQSVIGEIDYTGTAREDAVWWTLHDLHENNGLPEGISADDVYNLFWTNYHNSGEGQ